MLCDICILYNWYLQSNLAILLIYILAYMFCVACITYYSIQSISIMFVMHVNVLTLLLLDLIICKTLQVYFLY